MSAPTPTKAESSTTEKQQERVSIAELKNGKILFKQKPVSFEKQSETLQELVKFRSMLEERISNQEPPLSIFPDEHKPLIAKLAHESDKTLTSLAKHIHEQLIPTVDEDEDQAVASATSAALPPTLVERVIEQVLARNNYGLEAGASKFPAALYVWRWEVKKEHLHWLPKNSREKAELRQTERCQARDDLNCTFNALSLDDKNAIIDPKGRNKTIKDFNKPAVVPQASTSDTKGADSASTPTPSKKQGKKKAEDAENVDQPEKQPRAKKAVDPEKAAKEKEKAEKKAAQLEREKKEQEKREKSKSLMAKFFLSKPAKSPAKSTSAPDSAVAGPSKIVSDFEKTFRPFILQKDKTLAPVNWFAAEKKLNRRATLQAKSKEIIVIDTDDEMDVDMPPCPSEAQLANMSTQEQLHSIVSEMPPPPCRPRSHRQIEQERGYQTYHPISVRDLMAQLNEAEISGNDDLVRTILAKLQDRDLLPAKAFCFHDDARPGYFGTWTRSSRIIGARRPFAKDTLVFDYSYDSGEEWEEEPAGEDVVEDAEEEEGDADEQDSDLESWLVDDDDEPDMAALANASPPPLFDDGFLPPPLPPKRKAEADGEKKIGKKRKVVVPLVPFAKGPMLETTIGQCEYEPFRPYAIQRFNDTPFSVDPFTYVSSCIEDHKAFMRAATAPSPNATAGTKPNDPIFAVPALPPRLSNINNTIGVDKSTTPLNATPSPSNAAKKAPVPSKSAFPDAHMQLLLTKITQLQASSINSLVESIYLDLREHKVKKVAIEAKVREVSEKCKDKKYWVIKSSLLQGVDPVQGS